MYDAGDCVPQDKVKAGHLFDLVSAPGGAAKQCFQKMLLGIMHFEGIGMPPNKERAAQIWEQVAEAGFDTKRMGMVFIMMDSNLADKAFRPDAPALAAGRDRKPLFSPMTALAEEDPTGVG
jgi:hypothetical protein